MTIRTTVAAAALWMLAGAVSVQVGAQSAAKSPAAAGPTFAKDVAPILYKNCTNCHRPGEIAPMSLLTFNDARPWAKSIGTQVAKGAMPPWHADPTHGEFLNDRRLTETEKNTIVAWVNAGAPEGNPSDLPAQPAYASEWLLGQPDAVFSMAEDYPIPAQGTIAYQYFEIRRRSPRTSGFRRWKCAQEIRACCTTSSCIRARRCRRSPRNRQRHPRRRSRDPRRSSPSRRGPRFPRARPAALRCRRISRNRLDPTIGPRPGAWDRRWAGSRPVSSSACIRKGRR